MKTEPPKIRGSPSFFLESSTPTLEGGGSTNNWPSGPELSDWHKEEKEVPLHSSTQGHFPPEVRPQLLAACSFSSSLAKKVSRSVSFWIRRTSSSLPSKAAFCARVKLPGALTLLRTLLFRGTVKS